MNISTVSLPELLLNVSHTNLGPNVLEARYLCKYVNKASEKGLNSQPWSPLLSRKDDKIKCLDTEGKRNIVNFLNITQYLRFKLQFKVFTVAKTFDVMVFCVCWLFCRVWTTKMENGQWRCFFVFFFKSLSCCLVTALSHRRHLGLENCLCFKSVGPAKKKQRSVCPVRVEA